MTHRGGVGRTSWPFTISYRTGVLKFYSPTNTHQRPVIFQELCRVPGITNTNEMGFRIPQSSWGGSGLSLPSLINSSMGLYISTLDSLRVRPWAGHQRCPDEEDGPRLCCLEGQPVLIFSFPTCGSVSISKHEISEVTERKEKQNRCW